MWKPVAKRVGNCKGMELSRGHVALIEISSKSEWESLVAASSQGTIFHSWDWQILIGQSRHGVVKFLGFREGDSLLAACALTFSKRKGVTICRSSPTSVTPFGGLLFAPAQGLPTRRVESRFDEIVSLINEYLKRESVHHAILNNHCSLIDVRAFLWSGWTASLRYTYQQDLSDLPTLWKTMNNDIRRSYVKSERSGFAISGGDPEEFYDLLKTTYEDKGQVFGESFELIRALHELIETKGRGKLLVARDQGKAVAARYVLWDEKRGYYWLAGSKREYRTSGVNAYLTWKALETLAGKARTIDWCGANTPPIARYKSSFNPQLVPYYSVSRKTLLGMAAEKLYLFLNR